MAWSPPESDQIVWRPPSTDKIVGRPAQQPPGMLSALGAGAKQGIGDILYGGAQIGARMGPEEGAGAFTNPADLQARQQAVDRATTQREAAYAANPAVRAHPIIAGAGRIGGNIASTAPLAAIPGVGAALAAPGSALGRIGAATALGAGQGLAQPVPMAPGRSFGGEKAGQAISGAIGGAAGGALGEAAGSLLGNAIAGNNTAAIDRYLTGKFRQTVKPRQLSGRAVGAPQLGMQDNRILTVIDSLTDLAKKGALRITDDAGNLLPIGSTPKNLRQFSEGLDDAKRTIFQQYDAMAEKTGQQGIQIGLLPFAQKFREIANNKIIQDHSPVIARDAERFADLYERRLFYTPSELQEAVKELNRISTKDFRDTGFSHIKPVVDLMRETLDNTIASLQGPGYQMLKNQYGAIRSIEKDVASAAQREANKPPWGSRLANWGAIAELAGGLLSGHGAEGAALALGTEAAKYAVRYLSSPNRAIRRLFEQRANPPGVFRQSVGAGLLSAAPSLASGYLGGQALSAAATQRPLRPSVVGP